MEKIKSKIVYEDGRNTKVIKGYIIEKDEFTVTISAENTDKIITIGKRAIVKISEVFE